MRGWRKCQQTSRPDGGENHPPPTVFMKRDKGVVPNGGAVLPA